MSKKEDTKGFITDERTGGVCFTAAVFFVFAAMLINGLIKPEGDFAVYLSYFLPSVSLVGAFAVTFVICKTPFKNTLKLFNFKFKKRYYAVIILATAGILFGLNRLNDIFIEFLSGFGYEEQKSSLPELSFWSVILCTIIIALIPSVLEECLFRGFILRSAACFSEIQAVLISALLFSVYHMSPSKTLYQFAAGLVFSIICFKSGSLIPTVVIHFLNNFLIILNIYFNIFSFVDGNEALFTVIGVACLAAALILALTDREKNYVTVSEVSGGKASNFYYSALGGILGCLAVWFAGLL